MRLNDSSRPRMSWLPWHHEGAQGALGSRAGSGSHRYSLGMSSEVHPDPSLRALREWAKTPGPSSRTGRGPSLDSGHVGVEPTAAEPRRSAASCRPAGSWTIGAARTPRTCVSSPPGLPASTSTCRDPGCLHTALLVKAGPACRRSSIHEGPADGRRRSAGQVRGLTG